jgi:hypothetical protein
MAEGKGERGDGGRGGDDGLHVRKVDDVRDGSGRVVGVVVDVHKPSACPYQGAGATGPTGTSSGPAKVSTDAYRSGYERIFGGRAERGIA